MYLMLPENLSAMKELMTQTDPSRYDNGRQVVNHHHADWIVAMWLWSVI